MNFTAGVDSNQSFFRCIHPYVLFDRANVDRESTNGPQFSPPRSFILSKRAVIRESYRIISRDG